MGIISPTATRHRALLTVNGKRYDSGYKKTLAEAQEALTGFQAIRDAIPDYSKYKQTPELSKTDGFSAAAAKYLRINWIIPCM